MIAEPGEAGSFVPEWFRRLPGIDESRLSATNDGMTVKRCMPFLDALSLGWIIPLAATVRLEVADGGRTVNAGWDFDREMVSNHAAFQVAGNPFEPRPPLKFHNYWTVRTAPGWSCLFLPALNRPQALVEIFSGVVDTDAYAAPVNFPFVVTAPDGVYSLPQGTPLVQVVPFRRPATRIAGSVRVENDGEKAERRRIHRSTNAGAGWYRRHARDNRARVGHQR